MTLVNFSLKLYVQKLTFRNVFALNVWFYFVFFFPGEKNVEKDRCSNIAGTWVTKKTELEIMN